MKKRFQSRIRNYGLLAVCLALMLSQQVLGQTSWTGAVDLSWSNDGNWTGVSPPRDTSMDVTINAPGTTAAAPIMMNRTYDGGGCLEGNVYFDAGYIKINPGNLFQTGRTKTFNLGDGDVGNGTATFDLNGEDWTPNRDPANFRYNIRIKSDGTLIGTNTSQILCYNNNNRGYSLYVEGGLLDVPFLQVGKTGTGYRTYVYITSGTARVDTITASGRNNLSTLELTGGRLEIGGTAATDFDFRYTNLGNGTFSTKATTPVWSTLENANLTGNGGGDVTFDTTGAKDISWNGLLSGVGGLQAIGDGVFTLSAANTYKGDTYVDGASLNITGSIYNNGGTPLAATVTLANTSLTLNDWQTPFADLQNTAAGMNLDNGTLRATTTSTLDRPFTVGAGGATLESVAPSELWTINTPTPIDAGANPVTITGAGNTQVVSTINGTGVFTKSGSGTCTLSVPTTFTKMVMDGGVLVLDDALALPAGTDVENTSDTLLNANGYELTFGVLSGIANLTVNNTSGVNFYTGIIRGSIIGPGGVTKSTPDTMTLAGTHSYTGTTTVTDGTLAVTGLFYQGLSDATLDVAPGGTLLLAQDQNLVNLNLTLQGGHPTRFDDAFVRRLSPSTNNLTVANGTPLTINIDGSAPASLASSGLAIGGALSIAPADIVVNLIDFNKTSLIGKEFTIIKPVGGWAEADVSAIPDPVGSPIPAGYEIVYSWNGIELSGVLSEYVEPQPVVIVEPGMTNPVAVAEILFATPPAGSVTEQIQTAMQGKTIQEQDKIVQQFTPSMASALFASNVTLHREMLQQIGRKLDDSWDVHWGETSKMRGQRSASTRAPYLVYPGARTVARKNFKYNLWSKTFGYTGEQEDKDAFNGYSHNGYGAAVGADQRHWGGKLYTGLAAGYSRNKLTSNNWTSTLGTTETPAKTNTELYTMLGYSMTKIGKMALSSKVGGTWCKIQGTREPTNDGSLSYDTDAAFWFTQLTLSGKMVQRKYWSITPQVGCSYFGYWQNAYRETGQVGGTPFAMDVETFRDDYCELDVLFDSSFLLSDSTSLLITAGYRRVVGAEGAVLHVGADTLNYSVTGISPATDVLLFDIGVEMTLLERISVAGQYNYRNGGGGNWLHGVEGTLICRF